MHTEVENISIDEPRQIIEEETVPQGMLVLENACLYIELEAKRNAEIQSEMLETMRSLKADLDSLKVENTKLMNARPKHDEINEIILKD